MVGAAAALSGVTVSFIFYTVVFRLWILSPPPKTAHNSFIGCHYVRTHGHFDLCCACYAFSSRCKDSCRCSGAKRNLRSCNRAEPAAIPWLEARISVGEPPNKWCGEFFSTSKDSTSNFFRLHETQKSSNWIRKIRYKAYVHNSWAWPPLVRTTVGSQFCAEMWTTTGCVWLVTLVPTNSSMHSVCFHSSPFYPSFNYSCQVWWLMILTTRSISIQRIHIPWLLLPFLPFKNLAKERCHWTHLILPRIWTRFVPSWLVYGPEWLFSSNRLRLH